MVAKNDLRHFSHLFDSRYDRDLLTAAEVGIRRSRKVLEQTEDFHRLHGLLSQRDREQRAAPVDGSDRRKRSSGVS